ncbi:MAG: DNA-directed RNA polymerase subunit omega [Mucispirillum sp.]|nr:DNA-directed RNA polymerase subunit omega [Mucispirillum sp.]
MAFLDIERVINQKNVDSRFKLVHLAALRARELNNPDETTVLSDLKPGEKVTSKALTDIVRNRVKFVEIEDTPEEAEENKSEENN